MKRNYSEAQMLKIIEEEQLSEWLETAHPHEVYDMMQFIEHHFRLQGVYKRQLLKKIVRQYFGIRGSKR